MVYTSEQVFPWTASRRERMMLAVKANGGTVHVAVKHGAEFITTDTITEDTAGEFYLGGATVRLTPSGGAEFSLS
jgi:hypothetical protein